MSVRIRLTRVGNRNNPFYRIVVANGINPNNGKAIEYIGTYDPKGGGRSVLKKERYDYWLGVGAIPSDTVRSLIGRSVDHASTIQQPKASVQAEAEVVPEDAATEEVVEASAE
ncbi:MAG: 30S ribosomal protein S16 [Kiritimatiellia bacterium]